MAKTQATTTKRFGPRYGRKTKLKFSLIEQERKRKQTCPRCQKQAAKRIAAGIWECSSCNLKFAGRAYSA